MSKYLLKRLLMMAVSICLVGGLFTILSPVKTAHASCGYGQSWSPGGLDMTSSETWYAETASCGTLALYYQNDGNLVLYLGQTALWATGTENTTLGEAVFQNDGNLVVYDGSGHARWASGTNGEGATLLYLQEDGNLVIYRNNTPLWASNTCCH